jgi:hypothetical protein
MSAFPTFPLLFVYYCTEGDNIASEKALAKSQKEITVVGLLGSNFKMFHSLEQCCGSGMFIPDPGS